MIRTAADVRRLWRIVGAALIAAVVVLSLIPIEQSRVPGGDKAHHLIAYGTLMLWHAQLTGTVRGRMLTAAGFVLMGVTIEVLQWLTPWRTFELGDIAANATGIALGWVLAAPRTPDLLAAFTRVAVRRR